jgi:GT2 family glycosyltransferase
VETVQALLTSDYALHEIIVVDDASTDGSAEKVGQAFPGVTIVLNTTNVGFARSSNLGISRAIEHDAGYIFLLNNDAVVGPDTLSRLVAAIAAHDKIGAVMPKVYFYDKPQLIQSTGLGINRNSGATRHIGWRQEDKSQYDRPEEREGLHGCAILFRREAWARVGPFWEPYFAYFEETDWCVRARDMGYRLLFVPEAKAWHHGGASFDHASPGYLYLFFRNRLFFIRRNHQDRKWVGCIAPLLIEYARTIGRFLLKRRQPGHAAAICKAVYDFARGRAGSPVKSDRARKSRPKPMNTAMHSSINQKG